MIMPANYSVIAENELTYVDGGEFHFYVNQIDDGGQVLAENIVKWIGKGYAAMTLDTFIGTWFEKDATGDDATGLKGSLKKNIKYLFTWQNAKDEPTLGKIQYGVANAIGVASAIWVLGTYSDAVDVSDLL